MKTNKWCRKSLTDTHTVEQRSRVEDEGDHKGSRPQNFAPLRELQLQEPAEGNKWVAISKTARRLAKKSLRCQAIWN